jgi:WD40 repeat protein
MSSLADLPELVGFFSYSRDDDEDSKGALSDLRERIQRELRQQLGRSRKDLRLWQDQSAIAAGKLWETEIKAAVRQSAFFIPIITPTVVKSPYCKFELDSFMAREAELGRDDLVFPILYIRVPGLEDDTERQRNPVLATLAQRQYVDWREYRHRDTNATELRQAIEKFCAHICEALHRPVAAEVLQQVKAPARKPDNAKPIERIEDTPPTMTLEPATPAKPPSRRALLLGAGAVALGAAGAAGVWLAIARRRGAELVRAFPGHRGSISSVDFSPDGRLALSGSTDNSLRFWDIASGRELRILRHTDPVWSAAFSPDGRTVLSVGDGDNLKLWDVDSGRDLRTFAGHTDSIGSVAFAPDGRMALSGSDDGTARLWEVASGRQVQVLTGHAWKVLCVAFAPDGRTAVSGSADRSLKLWDIPGGRELHTFRGHTDDVNAIAFAPDGRTVLSGSADRTLRLWDIAERRQLRSVAGAGPVHAVACAPDGRTALSGGGDEKLTLWDIASAREVFAFAGHDGSVRSVAFAPDGRTALSGGGDNTVKLWRLN